VRRSWRIRDKEQRGDGWQDQAKRRDRLPGGFAARDLSPLLLAGVRIPDLQRLVASQDYLRVVALGEELAKK
jgi:hypothetical protein